MEDSSYSQNSGLSTNRIESRKGKNLAGGKILIATGLIIVVIIVGFFFFQNNKTSSTSSTIPGSITNNSQQSGGGTTYLTQSEMQQLFGSAGAYNNSYYINSSANFVNVLNNNRAFRNLTPLWLAPNLTALWLVSYAGYAPNYPAISEFIFVTPKASYLYSEYVKENHALNYLDVLNLTTDGLEYSYNYSGNSDFPIILFAGEKDGKFVVLSSLGTRYVNITALTAIARTIAKDIQ